MSLASTLHLILCTSLYNIRATQADLFLDGKAVTFFIAKFGHSKAGLKSLQYPRSNDSKILSSQKVFVMTAYVWRTDLDHVIDKSLSWSHGSLCGLREVTSCQDLSEHFFKEIQKVQPEGPYLFAGHSFGSLARMDFADTAEYVTQKTDIKEFSPHTRMDTPWIYTQRVPHNTSPFNVATNIHKLPSQNPPIKASYNWHFTKIPGSGIPKKFPQ